MFAIAPLDWIEWKAVLLLSAPVVLIDELQKLLTVRLRPDLLCIPHYILRGDLFIDNTRFSINQD
jgi:Ca2+ transporting ATPase